MIGGHKYGGIWKLHCITYDNDVISKTLAVINMAEVSKTRQIMTVFNIASKVLDEDLGDSVILTMRPNCDY